MANQEAFQKGFDQGMGKSTGKKDDIPAKLGTMLTPAAHPKIYKKGGKVKKTGLALVHKNEVVLTAKQAKKAGKNKTRKRTASKG